MKLPLRFYAVMERVKALLEADKPVRDGEWSGPEVECIREKLPCLITTKPVTYMVNLSAADFLRRKNKHLAGIAAWVSAHGGGAVIPFSIEWEERLWALRGDAPARAAFLAEVPGTKSALPRAIVTAYRELELTHFFTAGDKEVRCWTVLKGTPAPEAAGCIHSDFTKVRTRGRRRRRCCSASGHVRGGARKGAASSVSHRMIVSTPGTFGPTTATAAPFPSSSLQRRSSRTMTSRPQSPSSRASRPSRPRASSTRRARATSCRTATSSSSRLARRRRSESL